MSACCAGARDGKPRTWACGLREIAMWALPSTLLVMVPKCPACLAAYVTLWTGVGLSLAGATYLRWMLVLVGVAALLLLTMAHGKRIGALMSSLRQGD